MSALDGSVMNVILPPVSGSFHSSIAAVEWVITIYLLIITGDGLLTRAVDVSLLTAAGVAAAGTIASFIR